MLKYTFELDRSPKVSPVLTWVWHPLYEKCSLRTLVALSMSSYLVPMCHTSYCDLLFGTSIRLARFALLQFVMLVRMMYIHGPFERRHRWDGSEWASLAIFWKERSWKTLTAALFVNILGKGIQEMNLFHNKQIKDDLCVKDSFLNWVGLCSCLSRLSWIFFIAIKLCNRRTWY